MWRGEEKDVEGRGEGCGGEGRRMWRGGEKDVERSTVKYKAHTYATDTCICTNTYVPPPSPTHTSTIPTHTSNILYTHIHHPLHTPPPSPTHTSTIPYTHLHPLHTSTIPYTHLHHPLHTSTIPYTPPPSPTHLHHPLHTSTIPYTHLNCPS